MGQDGTNFDFRLRTTNTDLNGRNPEFISAGALSTQLVHLVYTFEGGTGRFYMDGAPVANLSIGGNLSNWMTGYRFGLGNEFISPDGRARHWLGTYHLVAVYDHALSAADVQQNYDAISGTGGGSTILLPGEQITVTQSAVLNQTTTNVATVQALDPLDATVFDTADATVTVTDTPSAIEVIKTANPDSLPQPGGDVTFSILINNLSATDAVTIDSLVDDIYGDLNTVGTCAVPQTLPVGGSYSCEFTVAVSGSAGDSFTDVVTASGLDDDLIPVSDDDDATVTITAPLVASIQVVKTADPTSIFAGETVNYTYEIVNTGDVTLHDVTLSDDKLGPITLPSTATTLDAGEHAIVTQFAVLNETTTNVATVEALDPLNAPVSDTDDVMVTVSTVNHPPVLAAIGDFYLTEGDTLTVPISAADQDVLDTLSFVDTNTPTFASFTDHGDRSATLELAPLTGDAGRLPDDCHGLRLRISRPSTISKLSGSMFLNPARLYCPLLRRSTRRRSSRAIWLSTLMRS